MGVETDRAEWFSNRKIIIALRVFFYFVRKIGKIRVRPTVVGFISQLFLSCL